MRFSLPRRRRDGRTPSEVAGRPTRRYIPGLAAIALLVSAGGWLVVSSLQHQHTDTRVLSVAGRQITLSYEVARWAETIAGDSAGVGAAAALSSAVADMKQAQVGLQRGDESLGLPATGAAGVDGLLAALDPAFRRLTGAAEVVLVEGAAVDPEVLAGMESDQEIFRAGMGIVVAEQEQLAAGRVEGLQRAELSLLGITLVALVLEALFLFRPAARQINRSWRERDQRHAAERAKDKERLEHLAQFDAITGLPNRTMLRDRLRRAMLRARRNGGFTTIVSMDLDGFKGVNDRYGHDTGDTLLTEAASRIVAAVRETDTVARIGGDEFVAILEGSHRIEDAEIVARKLLIALAEPFEIDGHLLFVTASAGIAIYPLDGDNPDDLLRDADIAMHAAKAEGANTYRFLTDGLREQTSERHRLMEDLRQALDAPDQFTVLYQPKVNMDSGAIVGVEALLRWHHPELGLIMPNRFIPLAEESDLIVHLGKLVLERACHQATEWMEAGIHRLSVSVNVSSRQFRKGDLAETVARALGDAGLDPKYLEVELTESILIDDDEATRTTIQGIKDLGVAVSIDDFGTGYSSLSYLKRFDIDTLKIDRSFVSEITENADDAAISEAIVGLGRSLRLQVIAEGVETPEQVAFLRRIGCDVAQGFLFSRPVTPEDIHTLNPVFPTHHAA